MFRYQNLTEDDKGKRRRALRWHGRAWWNSLHWEWSMLPWRLGVSVERGDEVRLSFSLRLLVFSIYVALSGYSPRRHREFDLRFSDGSVWFALWQDPWESSHNDPWWKQMHVLHLSELVLGKPKYGTEPIEERDVLIPMPEGAYPAKVKLEWCIWRRARWFTKRVKSADVKIEKGIPFEGKGENSWDCGEDAIYGLYTSADSVEDAIGKTVATALKDRKRYGTPSRIQEMIAAV